MTHGLFFELARDRRRLALIQLRERADGWAPVSRRARAPRITRAAFTRLMAR